MYGYSYFSFECYACFIIVCYHKFHERSQNLFYFNETSHQALFLDESLEQYGSYKSIKKSDFFIENDLA